MEESDRQIEYFLSRQQTFRPKGSSQIDIRPRQISEKIMKTNRKLYISTIDLEETLDRVTRTKIWEVL